MNQLALAWEVRADVPALERATQAKPRGTGIRYIGSKARVAEAILYHIGPPLPGDGVFVDAFAGTGVVALEAARRGWAIRASDHLVCAVALTRAGLTSTGEARLADLGGYEDAVALLNGTSPRPGYIFEEYSPASAQMGKPRRMYFTEENAAKIDAVRELIATWVRTGRITKTEELLLIADLLVATNRVANIAGTYGCFLRRWSPSAREPLQLRPRRLLDRDVAVEILNGDVSSVPISAKDVVYFDPPYTKRQYAAYYHVLETIAVGDRPAVGGITGLRPWRAKASDFCYRSRALGAIRRLIERTPASRVYLSYSSEGHVRLEELERELAPLAELTTHVLAEVGRYRPNRAARDAGSSVAEYLLELRKVPRLEAHP